MRPDGDPPTTAPLLLPHDRHGTRPGALRTAAKHERHARKQARTLRRHDRVVKDFDAVPFKADVGDDRCHKPLLDPVHHLVEPILALHDVVRAATGVSETGEEAGVGGNVDADDMERGGPKRLLQLGEDAVLIADLTVGDEHQDRVAGRSVGCGRLRIPLLFLEWLQEVEAGLQGQLHLRAAAGLNLSEPLEDRPAIAVGGRDERGGVVHLIEHIVEGDDRNTVITRKAVEAAGDGAAGGADQPASHAAGAVEEEDNIPRRPGLFVELRREDDERKCAVAGSLGASLLAPHADGPQGIRLNRKGGLGNGTEPERPTEDEVAVQSIARLDDHLEDVAPLNKLQRDRRREILEERSRPADPGADPEADRIREAGQEDRRRDPRGIRHEVGVGEDARAGRIPVDRRTGAVAL